MTEAFLYLSAITGFLMAWAIGAQDVSNALGTCVGSKAITTKQAIVIGGVFEFLGSLMGGDVAHTISKGIIHTQAMKDNVELYVMVMFCTLVGAFCWLTIATYFCLPVSTTHSMVGSIIGLGYVTYPAEEVNVKTLATIIISWITSPLMGFIISYSIFFIIYHYVLIRPQPEKEALRLLPYFYAATFGILSLFMCLSGPKLIRTDVSQGLMTSGLVSIAVFFVVAYRTSLVAKTSQSRKYQKDEGGGALHSIKLSVVGDKDKKEQTNGVGGTESDFRQEMAERQFTGLMILTACVVAFAHGSNDISNAIGPFSVIMEVNLHGDILEDKPTPKWVLVAGGVGIVLGLATYGHKVMATVGEKITKLTFTRGFAAQIGTALTVLTATIMGVSVSTTHCLIGAIAGVAMVESITKINIGTLKKIALSWVVTMPASALCSLAAMYVTYLLLDPSVRPN